ncbi:DUF1187 family protein [Enterobacter cancerogenus]|uniref:DUF1187 family protein n=1 Tax=Enterobacter cancerogenus TaxID=69218 RepID=UPI004058BB99
MYKIEASIIRAGSMPVHWTRYSDKPMNIKQCQQLFTPVKSQAKFSWPSSKTEIIDFRCIKLNN